MRVRQVLSSRRKPNGKKWGTPVQANEPDTQRDAGKKFKPMKNAEYVVRL